MVEPTASTTWREIAPHFERDGSLRDIYIIDTDMSDWQAIWSLLARNPDQLTFSIDGDLAVTPEAVADVFAIGEEHNVVASYSLGRQTINCHFFCVSEIEFDVDPRDIDCLDGANALGRFMRMLGQATLKPVILTHENSQAAVIARFDPIASKVEWHQNST